MAAGGIGARIARFWEKDIWRADHLAQATLRCWSYAVLRVISISATVFRETNAGSRAAALSFSSLLGLGPLIAIAMLVAGLVLGQGNPDLAVVTLNRLLRFVAPQLDQYEHLQNAAAHAGAAAGSVAVNPELVAMINGFIAGSRSGSAGVFGALSLVLIVLFLFKSVEDVFNEIWGVRRGRSWLMRVVFYWTILTLGAVLFFAAVALLGAGAFVNVFVGRLPFGAELVRLLRWSLPIFSFVLLVGVLTIFYRVIPHTRVFWRAAATGALVVALLLLLNNFLTFFYLERVIQTRSLYGSLGIVPVLMFGLYIFWLYVLVGGQISYAVQNVHYRNSQIAWGSLSVAMRDRIALVVLLAIGRRFRDCRPPLSSSALGTIVKVPSQVLNECLNRLADMGLIAAVPPAPGAPAELLYQPARPLDRITLFEFKSAADNLGDDPVGDALDRLDPIVAEFHAAQNTLSEHPFFRRTIEGVLAEGEKA